MQMQGYRLKTEVGVVDILGHMVLWVILSVVTLGIGLFFLPYSFAAFFVNRTYLVDTSGGKVGRFKADIELTSQIGHVVLWIFISVITLGIGYMFYIYKVWSFVLDKTRLVNN